jgi:hypothetical protein
MILLHYIFSSIQPMALIQKDDYYKSFLIEEGKVTQAYMTCESEERVKYPKNFSI